MLLHPIHGQPNDLKAAISANSALILLYWDIGKEILERQDKEGWGAKIIERLSTDLKQEFPGMKGFSPRNLKYMRPFAQNYPEREFVQEVLAQITWYHNIAIFEKIKKPAEREWYIHKIVEHGWSRNILVHQIENGLYHRQGIRKITCLPPSLPLPSGSGSESSGIHDAMQLRSLTHRSVRAVRKATRSAKGKSPHLFGRGNGKSCLRG
jgi:predicted nuclease of restriction endonuclease-like (RecB) superfamily